MNPKWLPTDMPGRMARTMEECGEVVQAVAKAQRFGMLNRHPNKRFEDNPTNAEIILAEFADLRHAMDAFERDLRTMLEPVT